MSLRKAGGDAGCDDGGGDGDDVPCCLKLLLVAIDVTLSIYARIHVVWDCWRLSAAGADDYPQYNYIHIYALHVHTYKHSVVRGLGKRRR